MARALVVTSFAAIGAALYGAVEASATQPPLSVSHVSISGIGRGAVRTVTVSGTGFVHGLTATVGGTGVTVSATALTNGSTFKTTLSASATAALGARTLTVHAGSQLATLDSAFTVNLAPTVTLATPSFLARGSGTQVVSIAGADFTQGAKATVGGSGVKTGATTVVSSTLIKIPVTVSSTAPLGTHAVNVTNPDQGASHWSVTVGPGPTVTSVSTATLSQGETTVATITGNNFFAGATVSLGSGVTSSIQSLSRTSIKVRFTVAGLASVGKRTLTVTNADLGRATVLNAVNVDYVPTFSKWAVGDGAVGWTTTLVRPTFTTAPALSFTGTGVTVSSETIDANHHVVVSFTVSSLAEATWRTLTITHGSSTWTVPNGLKVRLAPVVTSVTSLGQGATHQTVVVKGANFEVCAPAEPTVTVSGTGVTVNSVNSVYGNLMYVNLTVASAAAVGARDVTVTNCDSGGRATSIGVFAVEPFPSVSSIPPIAVGVSRYETVTGSGFTPATTLTLSGAGVGISHVTFVSATDLTVNVTASATAALGGRDVTATNLDGSHSVALGALVVDALPTFTSIAPSAILAGGSQLETVTGTGFSAGAAVLIGTGGTPNAHLTLGAVSFVSSTELQFTLSADALLVPGLDDVTVTNRDGGAVLSSGAFTDQVMLDTPAVTAVSTSVGPSGALNISYTGSANAPGGQSYTVTACTDFAMSLGCVAHVGFTSGSDLLGLSPGTNYYVTITATASTGYVAATSPVDGPSPPASP